MNWPTALVDHDAVAAAADGAQGTAPRRPDAARSAGGIRGRAAAPYRELRRCRPAREIAVSFGRGPSSSHVAAGAASVSVL